MFVEEIEKLFDSWFSSGRTVRGLRVKGSVSFSSVGGSSKFMNFLLKFNAVLTSPRFVL